MDYVAVHCDQEGLVWYRLPGQPPCCSGQRPDDFVDHFCLRVVHRVRLAGCPANAALALTLCALRRAGGCGPVEACALKHLDPSCPAALLLAADRVFQPASCGGWRVLSAADEAAYAVTARVAAGQPALDLLPGHPAWAAVSFPGAVDLHAVARVLAEVVDPRFFVLPDAPACRKSLWRYFGLDVREAGPALRGAGGVRGRRFRELVAAWAPATEAGRSLRCDFLRRLLLVEGQRAGGLRAAVVVGKRVLLFWLSVWADVCTPRPGGDALFVPELFFWDRGVATLYRSYAADLGAGPAA